MDDPVAVLENVNDSGPVEGAVVSGLSAGFRIKTGLVEDDSRSALGREFLYHNRLELGQVGVFEI
jgi:hypothetical protein